VPSGRHAGSDSSIHYGFLALQAFEAMQAPTTTAVADAQINSLFNSIPPREALVAERRISPLHKA
jgi:hypothetical protein